MHTSTFSNITRRLQIYKVDCIATRGIPKKFPAIILDTEVRTIMIGFGLL